MAISKARGDREYQKFCETPSGKTAVRICTETGEPIEITGSFVVASPGPIKITGFTVGDSSLAYPTANQSGRAALSVRNTGSRSIWIVNSTGISLATAGDDAWEIGSDETINFDLDDINKIILVCESGKTVKIQIMEIKGP